eukprot:15407049-Alexandrium_andersonii.AAC.1
MQAFHECITLHPRQTSSARTPCYGATKAPKGTFIVFGHCVLRHAQAYEYIQVCTIAIQDAFTE